MKKFILASAVLAASAITAQAATITPAAGLNLARNQAEDAAVQVFSEQAGVSVAANAVTVDYLVGANLSVGDTENGVSTFASGQSLTAGTYDSFLVHFDPSSTSSVSNIVVDFGATIVGVILSNSGTQTLLNVSDAIFGTAANYDNHIGRRTEDTDSFELTGATSLTLSFRTNGTHVDNIRVLTEAAVAPVPVPASLPLMLAGFGGLAMLRRRNKA